MDNEPPFSTPRYQRSSMQGVEVPLLLGGPNHGQWSDENPTRGDPTDHYSAMNHINFSPPAGYTGNVVYGDPPHLDTGLVEHYRDQSHHGGHTTPGIAQHTPIASGPPLLESSSPIAPDIPNHRPRRHRLPLHHVVGPSQGNRGLVPRHSGMSAAEGLKRLASDYLHSPDSHVDRLRLKRKRSGGYKVLILLEIDD